MYIVMCTLMLQTDTSYDTQTLGSLFDNTSQPPTIRDVNVSLNVQPHVFAHPLIFSNDLVNVCVINLLISSLSIVYCRCKNWLKVHLVKSYNVAFLRDLRYSEQNELRFKSSNTTMHVVTAINLQKRLLRSSLFLLVVVS